MFAIVMSVKPCNSTANCPGQPCLSLSDMPGRYFTTGSTFVFLAGNHSLHTVISLTNSSDITLKGVGNGPVGNSPTTRIFLEGNATILCDHVSKLNIRKLVFNFHRSAMMVMRNNSHQ